jgi:hypothetical protein
MRKAVSLDGCSYIACILTKGKYRQSHIVEQLHIPSALSSIASGVAPPYFKRSGFQAAAVDADADWKYSRERQASATFLTFSSSRYYPDLCVSCPFPASAAVNARR